MAFSLFPDLSSAQHHLIAHRISVFSRVSLGCGLLFLIMNTVGSDSNISDLSLGDPETIGPHPEIFESLPPQVLEFSLRGATY